MTDNISKLEYSIIEYTKCGDEPLSVIIGAFSDEYNLAQIIDAVDKLLKFNYLEGFSDTGRPRIEKRDLVAYVEMRKAANEVLSEYPEVCEEYHFFATERGIAQLREEDRPVNM